MLYFRCEENMETIVVAMVVYDYMYDDLHKYCCVCAPSDDYVSGCLFDQKGQQNVGYAPDG